jgi:hypothetical protein
VDRDGGPAMYLETSAMYLLELHRTREADLRREMQEALRRGAHLEAMTRAETASGGVAGVAFGDGAGDRSDPSPDLGRPNDLHPAPRPEHHDRRFVRPVQAQPKP